MCRSLRIPETMALPPEQAGHDSAMHIESEVHVPTEGALQSKSSLPFPVANDMPTTLNVTQPVATIPVGVGRNGEV